MFFFTVYVRGVDILDECLPINFIQFLICMYTRFATEIEKMLWKIFIKNNNFDFR